MGAAKLLEGKDPYHLLVQLRKQWRGRGRSLLRLIRLAGAAACRRVESLIGTSEVLRTLAVVERFADTLATAEELHAGFETAREISRQGLLHFSPATSSAVEACMLLATQADTWRQVNTRRWSPWSMLEAVLMQASWAAAGGVVLYIAGDFVAPSRDWRADVVQEETQQCHLLRDLFTGLVSQVEFDPAWAAWQDGQVQRLATGIYAERSFDDLPVLADALEEAGCTDPEILGHCRNGLPHARGCWVVDRLRLLGTSP